MSSIRHRRSAFSLTEVMVCASLLLTVMSFVATISLRANQLWKNTRMQTIGLDELSNQMELLTMLDAAQVEQALTSLELSESTKRSMPQATISGELIRQDDSAQVVLTLRIDGDSDDSVQRNRPLSLVGFLSPDQGGES